jgi:[ribosomal protein S5]-alanine N-acetyltransferase
MNIKIEIVRLDLTSANALAELLNHDESLKRALGSKSIDNNGENFLRRVADWQAKTVSTTFAIKADSSVVGLISLSHQNRNDNSARIGYWLSSKYWNRGICSIAFDKVITNGRHMGFKTFRAKVPRDNVASLRIWKKRNAQIVEDGKVYKVEICDE